MGTTLLHPHGAAAAGSCCGLPQAYLMPSGLPAKLYSTHILAPAPQSGALCAKLLHSALLLTLLVCFVCFLALMEVTPPRKPPSLRDRLKAGRTSRRRVSSAAHAGRAAARARAVLAADALLALPAALVGAPGVKCARSADSAWHGAGRGGGTGAAFLPLLTLRHAMPTLCALQAHII